MSAAHKSPFFTGVAVLYVDPRGPYPMLTNEWYEHRGVGRRQDLLERA